MRKTIIIILLFFLIITACSSNSIVDEVKPDDELSKLIFNETDGVFSYLGVDRNAFDEKREYTFFSDWTSLTADNISLFINSVRSISLVGDEKICVHICALIPQGVGGLCSLSNYYDSSDDEYYIYSDMCVYTITWNEDTAPEALEPSTFTGVEGIKYLIVADKMNEKAKEQGIDWYEIWPDLEGIEVIPTPDL